MKKYNFLNLIRLVMALIVVANHLHPIDFIIKKYVYLNNIYDFIITMAVPFFFISTGFFIGKKIKNIENLDKKDHYIFRKMLFNDIKYYVIFTIIYMPLTIYGFINDGNGIVMSIIMFFRGFFFVGENFNSWILWYLLSEIYFMLYINLFNKKIMNFKNVFKFGILLYIIGIILNVFNNISFTNHLLLLIQKGVKFFIPKGRIFYSFVFIPIGILISKDEALKKKKEIIILIIGIIFINSIFINEVINKIGLFFISIMFFKLIINCKFRHEKIADFCKKLSKDLYFYHLLVWSALSYVIDGYIYCNFGMNYYLLTISIIILLRILMSFKNFSKQTKIQTKE